MKQNTPTSNSRPPVMLVKTWLVIYDNKSDDCQYAKRRATDLLELIFGSVEFARSYVKSNENNIYNLDQKVHGL